VGVALAVAGTVAAVMISKKRPITLRGAVVLEDTDIRKQAPIAGVTVTAADGVALTNSTSDFSGFFYISLLPTIVRGQPVTLQFRHPEYQPVDLPIMVGDELSVVRMVSLHPTPQPPPNRQEIILDHLIVRYSEHAMTATNIGSGVKAFEVANTGNVPCDHHPPCSPDGKWKASIGGISLDANADNEFRNTRLSCVAGPCPFTQVQSDGFSKGGRHISVSVLNWSDTATFVLEAEVFRNGTSTTIQHTYPVLLGRRLNFTLPPAADGASIEAEVDGEDIVFPLGLNPILSWAECEVRADRNQMKAYRCELKPGYAFKDYAAE